jgi:hypothetical protein
MSDQGFVIILNTGTLTPHSLDDVGKISLIPQDCRQSIDLICLTPD